MWFVENESPTKKIPEFTEVKTDVSEENIYLEIDAFLKGLEIEQKKWWEEAVEKIFRETKQRIAEQIPEQIELKNILNEILEETKQKILELWIISFDEK
jgi:uncharacterized protein YllA (UPF0747 family)